MKTRLYILTLICILMLSSFLPAFGQRRMTPLFPSSGSSFGITSILDNFNRTDEGPPPSSNWTTGIFGGTASHKVLSNQLATNVSAATSFWNASTFGPDVEAYITVTADSINDFELLARLQGAGSATADGYSCYWGYGNHRIYRYDDGSSTLLQSTTHAGFTVGHKYGIEVIGSSVKCYVNVGSVWTQTLSATDSTYSSGGHIGIYHDGATGAAEFDDFAGGSR